MSEQESKFIQGQFSLNERKVCCLIRSDAPAYNARLIKVAESAAEAGASVTILFTGIPTAETPQGPFDTVRVKTETRPSEHPIWLIRVVTNLWRELVANQWRMAAAALRVRADVYHAHFLATLLPAFLAARVGRAALVYDTRDLYVDAAVAMWPWWKKRYFNWLEARLIGRADAVLAVSEPMAKVFEDRYGVNRVHVVMNGPYECSGRALPASEPVRLIFQGAFRYNRNLASLVRAMDLLRGKAQLTLQGWGDVEDELRGLVEQRGLQDSIFFRKRCDPRDVVACAREYDVGVICYRADTLNLEVTVPNKLLDYIGAGLAVAASDLPGHRSVLESAGCGVLIDPTSDETIARGLDDLVSDPERVTQMKMAAVDACCSLSWAEQSKRLIGIYASLLESQAAYKGQRMVTR